MKILLAIDDSECSGAALEGVLAQFDPKTSGVMVLHALDLFVRYAGLAPVDAFALSRILEDERKAAEALVKRAENALLAAGFKVTSVIQKGEARSVILDQASNWHADLIVVGSHGRSALGRLLVGSVSEAVMRHADSSVLIVRAGRKPMSEPGAWTREAKAARKGEVTWQKRRQQKGQEGTEGRRGKVTTQGGSARAAVPDPMSRAGVESRAGSWSLTPGPRKAPFLDRCGRLGEVHPEGKAARVEAETRKFIGQESGPAPTPRPRVSARVDRFSFADGAAGRGGDSFRHGFPGDA
jgi:nucleotide-binding universal stress UspA family protein